MTNEFVFGYTFIGFPNVFEDPSKVDRAKVGYNYKGLFKNGVAQIPELRRRSAKSRTGLQLRAASKWAARRRACTPTSTCPASATP